MQQEEEEEEKSRRSIKCQQRVNQEAREENQEAQRAPLVVPKATKKIKDQTNSKPIKEWAKQEVQPRPKYTQ